jgi:hypothetical protein
MALQMKGMFSVWRKAVSPFVVTCPVLSFRRHGGNMPGWSTIEVKTPPVGAESITEGTLIGEKFETGVIVFATGNPPIPIKSSCDLFRIFMRFISVLPS